MKKILFVCVENACRSQIAKGLLNHLTSQAIADSAGTQLADHVNPNAITVMKEIGIDISEEQPQTITYEMNQTFDYIVTMGCIEGCPVTPREKTIEWNIPDPKNQPLETFREIRDLIKTHVEELISTYIES